MDVSFVTQRRVRHFLLATLIILYGTITVGGPTLHALPGGEDVKVGTPAHDEGGSDRPTSSQHDCPICHFLSLGQLAVDSTHVLSMDVVLIKPADDLPLIFPAAVDRPSGPRAPPLA
jgi:hypothetical protein